MEEEVNVAEVSDFERETKSVGGVSKGSDPVCDPVVKPPPKARQVEFFWVQNHFLIFLFF